MAELILLSAIWGVSFLMIRIAASVFPPVWVGFLRASTGALLLWIVLLASGYKLPPRRLFPWLFLVALFNNAIPFSFFAWGERTVPSSMAAVVNATTPIWTLLLSLAVSRTRASLHVILGVIIGFAGVALVVFSRPSTQVTPREHGSMLFGILIIALGALGYAIATVIAKTKLKALNPLGLATAQLSLAALMLTPLALVGPHPAVISPAPILSILVLGFAGSGVAYLLYYNLLSHISATQVAAVTYLLPVWGIFWGMVAHEIVAPLAYGGVIVVIAGLALMNRPARPTPRLVEATAD
ncbi:Permease of the drug/metabolite transporter (DMT) superfamily [Acidisarcina polymorpha]|uniref:Permease of the drug/metabolite transporter (DMT) superfamily n=1 Tax=Acidisarcina polymorpha TaxID=2211140 RepID=A0A2Z5G319_9BACT|nr:DMT family transporter [Acidisarcina polymorpha]AXC13025.1 Permease of the drug/metabolite transporter (DMT) superfamily [Acidisarcina polymorpha]